MMEENKKRNNRLLIQNTNINIKINEKLKAQFIEQCEKDGTSYSEKMRDMIKFYLRESEVR